MSTWHTAKKDDLGISLDGKDFHICFDSDYSGAIYVEVPLVDVMAFLAEHIKETTVELERRKSAESQPRRG